MVSRVVFGAIQGGASSLANLVYNSNIEGLWGYIYS